MLFLRFRHFFLAICWNSECSILYLGSSLSVIVFFVTNLTPNKWRSFFLIWQKFQKQHIRVSKAILIINELYRKGKRSLSKLEWIKTLILINAPPISREKKSI